MSQYRHNAHCIYLCDYHLVITTKYRRKIINPGMFAYLKQKLLEITRYYPQLYLHEVNHDRDHIHMLISIPPQMAVGTVVRLIKTNTSRKIKEQFLFLKRVYWGTDGIWSDGYFVSTVGVSATHIKQYIKLQGQTDTGRTAKLSG